MEASSGTNSETYRNSSSSSSSNSDLRRYGIAVLRFFRAPVSTVLQHSGILRPRPDDSETEGLLMDNLTADSDSTSTSSSGSVGNGEVSIRIIGSGEQDSDGNSGQLGYEENDEAVGQIGGAVGPVSVGVGNGSEGRDGERGSVVDSSFSVDSGDREVGSRGVSDSSYQRYDIQQVARWVEQILPFSLLLLVIFIRQHLQGFFVTIWITAVLFKSNDILQKQTSLKGERKTSVLVGYCVAFMLHVIGIYWLCLNDELFYQLLMIPPKSIPPFWHAIFVILANDTMARQAAMAFKLVVLIYYKNGRGHSFRRQGQMLALVEYTLLLYRALLPTPVWYRFFWNKEYGSLFSSLTTGFYLTFKLTSVVEKVQSFFAALRSLSQKEIHYGTYATSEQVNAAGDLCAICQEKMHTPILLRCKHIFCEDCVSEWFERERTCPLCRASVRPADLRSFGDGSTSLFFQLF